VKIDKSGYVRRQRIAPLGQDAALRPDVRHHEAEVGQRVDEVSDPG
jgi:hypothetical protein